VRARVWEQDIKMNNQSTEKGSFVEGMTKKE
jgi:hypothetical protein